MLLIFKEKYW